jgi:predicted RNA binding protein YcfA (HicA-like mRNA interferase family)
MPKLPVVSGKEMLAFLGREGFTVSRSRGSHFILRHPGKNLSTTVPVHGKEVLRPGTLLGILSDISMSKEDFCAKFKG